MAEAAAGVSASEERTAGAAERTAGAAERTAGADDWIDTALARAGLQRTGPVATHRERPWGTVLVAPTSRGQVWMKASAASTAFEAGLYEVLADAVPSQVLTPLAIDAARGWMLLPDGGTTLYDQAAASADERGVTVDGLQAALEPYARLQLALAARVGALLGAGVVDMRPEQLPARFREALTATAAHAHRPGGAADAGRHAQVAALEGDVAAWAAELAASPFQATLDHNDLHSGNVLVDGASPRFYDWGDSVVAHPFASMLVPITFVRDRVLGGCPDDDPRLLGLRDAYLAPFALDQGVAAQTLVPTLELACRLAKIARALIWQRALDGYGPEHAPPEWAGAPLSSLASLLDASPYGGG